MVRRSVDSLAGLQGLLTQLRQKLARDPDYFTHVYNYTFEFSRPPGQRSLGARAAVSPVRCGGALM